MQIGNREWKARISLLRSQRGQGMIEGVGALVLVVGATVLGTLLLVNSGMATFYKERLGFIAERAAHYAAGLPSGQDPTSATTALVHDLMSKMGLPTSGSNVEVVSTNLPRSGLSGVSVTVTAQLPIMGKEGIFPIQISLRDTATAQRSSGSSTGFAMMGQMRIRNLGGIGSAMQPLYVPIMGYSPGVLQWTSTLAGSGGTGSIGAIAQGEWASAHPNGLF